MNKKLIWVLAALMLCGLTTFTSCTRDEGETMVYATPLRAVLTGMDYGDSVLVVGHKSPDCDAVLSAITYASLLQRLGINAKARVAGKVICEPRYVLQAGIDDIGSYYSAMREARTSFDGMSDEDILRSDYKEYEIEGLRVGIGSVMASRQLGVEELCRRMRLVMPTVREEQGLDMLFMMLGDREADVTHLPFSGEGAQAVAEAGFHTTATADGCIITSYQSSRKAQVLPAITEGIRNFVR